MEELEKYKEASQNLKNVSKGGKDYASCSYMDISIRINRLKEAKEKLIISLGEKEFEKLGLEDDE